MKTLNRIKYPILWVAGLTATPWVNHFLISNLMSANSLITLDQATRGIYCVQVLGLCWLIPAVCGAFE